MLPHYSKARFHLLQQRRLPRPHLGDIAVSLGTRRYRIAEYLVTILDHVFDAFSKDETPVADIQAIL